MQQSFKHSPLMAPLVVRRLPGRGRRFEVVAGHRRLAAAKAAGWAKVECRIVDVNELGAEQLSLEENLRRRAVADEPGAMAKLLALYEAQNPSRPGRPKKGQAVPISGARKVAAITGKSLRSIRRLVKIGTAGKMVKALRQAGKLTVQEADRLARLPPHERKQQVKLAVKVSKRKSEHAGVVALGTALRAFKAVPPAAPVKRRAATITTAIEKLLT